ncbi:hypothetical protein GCM10008018_49340 [Paenibacillus marchantiophytorum]|uniref:DUF1468 domain-containing protein n=1 Tax=Paenibacillus marchantiophytorum TaxID=1619310 RepID=A0ABQ1F1L2_9BACL|nr:tripartite tricarboxylate transporter TctB family protein [Paenibacillus marchantiophytorum]GFZ97095.1 hypothetical protein GCM10008018_49340 [Paenibacillus marchantiophytorum]
MKASCYAALAKSAVPFAVGLFFFILSRRLSFGTWNDPGPGLWPTCLSALIMLVSLLLFFMDRRVEEEESFTRDARFPLYGLISLAIFILLFDQIGLTLPCLAAFVFWIRFLGKESWRSSILVSLGLTAAIYAIFAWGLDIPFPDDKLLHLFG